MLPRGAQKRPARRVGEIASRSTQYLPGAIGYRAAVSGHREPFAGGAGEAAGPNSSATHPASVRTARAGINQMLYGNFYWKRLISFFNLSLWDSSSLILEVWLNKKDDVKISYRYYKRSKKTLIFLHGLLSDMSGKKSNFLNNYCKKKKFHICVLTFKGMVDLVANSLTLELVIGMMI